MTRSARLLFLVVAPLTLWSQRSGDFLLVARRSGIAEIIDAVTLQTVTRIHFDFLVERMSGIADSSVLSVDGYTDGPCCKHYRLDLATGSLTEVSSPDSPAHTLISPDGRWQFTLNSFRGPSVETLDLRGRGQARKLLPPGLPPGDESGNWYAQGAWSGSRFYLYVSRPGDAGLLWTVSPGAESLPAGIPVSPFNEAPNCYKRLPVVRDLVAAGGNLFLYEPFGNRNKGARHCEDLPGGAWMLDPTTGRLTRQIATELHFSGLIADPTEPKLYGIALGSDNSLGEPEQLVRLNPLDGTIINSRILGPGESLQVSVARLRDIRDGDVTVH
jgi:hypothetical protein